MKLSSCGYLIKEGLKNIWTNRMMSLASIVVLASCLIITGAASLISINVSTLISKIGDDNEVKVYLKYELSDIDSLKIGSEIQKINNIEECTFYSNDEAIKDYKKTLGNLYESMQDENNPFMNAYKIKLKDLSKYSETMKEVKKIDGVESVSDRSDIAGKLTKLNHFVTLVGSWVVAVLGIVTLFIISNTIKMTMYSRRYEISIMKSVGATNAFVRIPFLVEAMAIGLISGLLSSGLLIGLYNPVKNGVSGIIYMLRNATLDVEEVWLPMMLLLAGIGMLIGLVGGFMSVTKYLKKEGGEILGW